jgi:hypothetical protein
MIHAFCVLTASQLLITKAIKSDLHYLVAVVAAAIAVMLRLGTAISNVNCILEEMLSQ